MPEQGAKGTAGTADHAIASIVEMKPQKVSVMLRVPTAGRDASAVVSLEWSREDTNMPLSELLKRVETHVAQFGAA